ncbi:MAG: alpha/beta hydrolase [Xanthobacteraceae bacterium]|nr:alpha/beta hydrolase [Xanthobacteraceae bacterium]
MPYAPAGDGVRLHYEEAGHGTAILFVHEFAADGASWEPQMRHFSRGHRCIAYSARGYAPSDIPADDAAYRWEHFRDDALAVLDHLSIPAAHLVGLSMGAYSSLQAALKAPERALSLTLAGAGSGFEAARLQAFRDQCRTDAERFAREGGATLARLAGMTPGRIPFLVKDPRGFQEFYEALARRDATGSAFTMRNFQGGRPPLSDYAAQLQRLATPTLIVVGDEDDACIESSLFLKRHIAASGLAMFPKTGHVLNQEEPALFNDTLARFLALVEAGRWGPRDPRSVRA